MNSPSTHEKPLSIADILRTVITVRFIEGFVHGISGLTWGVWFHDNLLRSGAVASEAMSWLGGLFAISFGAMALLEIPTGAIGDAVGRRRSVSWSFQWEAAYCLCMTILAFTTNLGYTKLVAIIAVLCVGIGFTLQSGSFEAWAVDAIRNTDSSVGYEYVFSRASVWTNVGLLLGATAGIVTYVYGLLMIAWLALTTLCAWTAWFTARNMRGDIVQVASVTQLTARALAERMREIMRVSWKVCRMLPPVWSLMLTLGAYFFLYNLVQYMWPVAMKAHLGLSQFSTEWIALTLIITTFGLISPIIFARVCGRWQKNPSEQQSRRKLRHWFTGACLSAALTMCLLSASNVASGFQFWSFAAALLGLRLVHGLTGQCYSALINYYIPAEFAGERATIMSIGSMLRSAIVALFCITAIGDSATNTIIYWAIPAVMLLVAVIGTIVILHRAESTD